MHKAVEEFVERMAVTMEAHGLPRIAGRLFAFLLVHGEAFSLDELAEGLQVSKASVSTNARLLEQLNILERSSAPGDRRDYYRMAPDAWEGMLRTAEHKWNVMRVLLTAGAASLPEEMEEGRARLIEAEQFHLLLLGGLEEMKERWIRRRGAAAEAGSADAAGVGGEP